MDIKEKCLSYAKEHINDDIKSIKTELNRIILNDAEISLGKNQYFFGDIKAEGLSNSALGFLWEIEHEKTLLSHEIDEFINGNEVFAFGGGNDFNHTAPNYENVLSLGLFGIKKLAEEKIKIGVNTNFYAQVISYYENAFLLFDRMINLIDNDNLDKDLAPSLTALKRGAPKTLYQAMQTLIVYFTLQQIVDTNPARTLGRIDSLLYPFYLSDINNGILDKIKAQDLIEKFLIRLSEFKVTANVPYSIGGVVNGKNTVNELSYLILDKHIKINSPDLKLHFLYSTKTPNDLVKIAIKGIIEGSNSIVFVNDTLVKTALKNIGINNDDAENYVMVGCYEPAGREELPCSCAAFINLAKALEVTINGGKDLKTDKIIVNNVPTSFEDFNHFYNVLKQVLNFFARGAIAIVSSEEKSWKNINTGAYLSSTFTHAIINGKDVYADYGAKYQNTSINAQGLANIVDGIIAVKNLVFNEKALTLKEFNEILKNNWIGHEALLTKIKDYPKYGQNDESSDYFAIDIINFLASKVNGVKNVKGGIFRLGAFSIDTRITLGKHTSATADGRRAYSPLSKNLCANLGADKKGITAHLLSASKINGVSIPNGAVLDIVLHSSSVKGERGTDNLLATLNTYIKRGGFAVHYNVLNPSTLKDAKLHPEKHPNLQVRRCGWNALFNTLTEVEKDEFIFNAEQRI